jgi:hypothetical protein
MVNNAIAIKKRYLTFITNLLEQCNLRKIIQSVATQNINLHKQPVAYDEPVKYISELYNHKLNPNYWLRRTHCSSPYLSNLAARTVVKRSST